MVDVSEKGGHSATSRRRRFVAMRPSNTGTVETGEAKKGDVIGAARIAGIMAAKRTHELIPLCHPLAITKATVDFMLVAVSARHSRDRRGQSVGQTGVEMEALTAVSVACLTLYDMLKAVDRAMRIGGIRLLEKAGGRSGPYRAAAGAGKDG